MNLRDAKPAIVEALERLRQLPESSRPFVVIEATGGGAFVQFAGSDARPLTFDVPLTPEARTEPRFNLAGFTGTGWGLEKKDVSPAEGATLAVDMLGVFGLELDAEVTIIEEHGGGRA